eukprot:4463888-Amphidinium_carterae.1
MEPVSTCVSLSSRHLVGQSATCARLEMEAKRNNTAEAGEHQIVVCGKAKEGFSPNGYGPFSQTSKN